MTCDLDVPAAAEFVLEGYIDPREPLVIEGPFGDHTGFYSEADLYPQVHITAVTMRRNPVYASTIVGRPPMEDFYLGHATERIFLPLLKLTIPEIVDYHMPAEGIFHNLVFVSIDKQYPGQAYKVMNAMWGQGLMSLAKVLVIVDKEVNVRNPQEAWWVALNNIDPERDTRFTMGPVDVLDHSSRAFTYGSKMGIDATRKWPEEGFTRNWPKVIEMDAATRATVDALWPQLGHRGTSVIDHESALLGARPLLQDAVALRSGAAVRHARLHVRVRGRGGRVRPDSLPEAADRRHRAHARHLHAGHRDDRVHGGVPRAAADRGRSSRGCCRSGRSPGSSLGSTRSCRARSRCSSSWRLRCGEATGRCCCRATTAPPSSDVGAALSEVGALIGETRKTGDAGARRRRSTWRESAPRWRTAPVASRRR